MRCQSLWSPCKTCCKVCQFHFPSGESGHSGELNQAGGPWEGGGGWLLGVFHPQANVGIVVFNSSSYTEPASLASIGLCTGLFFRTSFLKDTPDSLMKNHLRLPDELGGGGSCPSQAQLHVLGQAAQLDGKACLLCWASTLTAASALAQPLATLLFCGLLPWVLQPSCYTGVTCYLVFFGENSCLRWPLGVSQLLALVCTEVQFWFE